MKAKPPPPPPPPPRILVIDDVYGRVDSQEKNREREEFCYRTGLRDVTTGGEANSAIGESVAEAVFCSGQSNTNDFIENDIDGTMDIIRTGWRTYPRWALLILDLHFATGPVVDGLLRGRDEDRATENLFGLKLLERIFSDSQLREVPVLIVSSVGKSKIRQIVADRGVYDYIDHKEDFDERQMQDALLNFGLIEDDRVIGHSIKLLRCLRDARRRVLSSVEGKPASIFLLGETGTGKELFAEYVHRYSGRPTDRFRPVLLSGITETLVDSTLFGVERGRVTGVSGGHSGAFEEANGGTIFLDEFMDIPQETLRKLMRVLEQDTRTVKRQGGHLDIEVDVLVVMATNRLDALEAGVIDSDLYFRIGGDPIMLPPLRDRAEDIQVMTEHFIRSLPGGVCELDDGALTVLRQHDWPGNVRELKLVLGRCMGRNRLGLLTARSLEEEITRSRFQPAHVEAKESAATTAESSRARSDYPSEGSPSGPPTMRSSLADLLLQIRSFSLDKTDAVAISGSLRKVKEAHAHLIAELLTAALEITKKKTAGNPEGEQVLTAAMKLASGQEKMITNQAQAMFIRTVHKSLFENDERAFMEFLIKHPSLWLAHSKLMDSPDK